MVLENQRDCRGVATVTGYRSTSSGAVDLRLFEAERLSLSRPIEGQPDQPGDKGVVRAFGFGDIANAHVLGHQFPVQPVRFDDELDQSASDAFSVAGGGDTLVAIDKYGIADQISYISTGGGAFLEFVEGKKLPAVAMLEKRARDVATGLERSR